MPDYAKHLDLIRQLREMGAVKVSVGDVVVEFSGRPVEADEEVQLRPALPDTQAQEEQALREWQALQYHSSRG